MENELIPLPQLAMQRRFAELVDRAAGASHETETATAHNLALTASFMARLSGGVKPEWVALRFVAV